MKRIKRIVASVGEELWSHRAAATGALCFAAHVVISMHLLEDTNMRLSKRGIDPEEFWNEPSL